MVRTIIAFDNEASGKTIAATLERNGISVRCRCTTGHEVIRAAKKMGGGVVVCGYKLPDMTAEQISEFLAGLASFLVVSKPTNLSLIEDEDIFKLPTPVRSGELIGAVNMLIQLDQRRSVHFISKRTKDEEELIHRAKLLIMEKNQMTEDQAHRYIQRKSMETSSKMADTANLILTAFD